MGASVVSALQCSHVETKLKYFNGLEQEGDMWQQLRNLQGPLLLKQKAREAHGHALDRVRACTDGGQGRLLLEFGLEEDCTSCLLLGGCALGSLRHHLEERWDCLPYSFCCRSIICRNLDCTLEVFGVQVMSNLLQGVRSGGVEDGQGSSGGRHGRSPRGIASRAAI